jgi:hypothetical protein
VKSAGALKTKGQHLLLILRLKVKQLTRHVIVFDKEVLLYVHKLQEAANLRAIKIASPVSEARMLGLISDFAFVFVFVIIRSKVDHTLITDVLPSKEMVTDTSRGELAHSRVKHQNQSYKKEAKVSSGSRSLSHLARRLSET